MANYNIEMNYYNGRSYDILQPKTSFENIDGVLSVSKLLGVLPASKGGTGQSSLSSAMYSLINSGTTTSLSSSSYVPFITGSSTNKCTISTLSNYIEDSIGLEIEIHKFGSYMITDRSVVVLFTFDSSQIYSMLYIEKNLDSSVSLSLNDSEQHDIAYLARYNIFTIGNNGGSSNSTQYFMGYDTMGTLNLNGTNTVYGRLTSVSGTSVTITVYGIKFV